MMILPVFCSSMIGATSFEQREAPVTIATWPSSLFSVISTPSLRSAPGRDRPAVDDLAAAADPDTVVQVESRPDLPWDEVDPAAEWGRTVGNCYSHVLVAHGDV